MKRKPLLLIIILGVLVVFLWSPWIGGQYAKERAVAEFERAWLNVVDGCGFGCHGCLLWYVTSCITIYQVTQVVPE